mgnify:FL=1
MKKKYLIIPIILIIITCNVKCFASTNNEIITKEFQTTQNAEKEFLNEIYNTETENMKIKNLDKEISEDNYRVKEIIETKELTNQDRDYITQQFGEKQSYNDGEYQGELTISDIKIETINNGSYQEIDEKVLDFTNYSDNDLINIEKEITLDNTIYYLINVNWEADSTGTIDGETIPKTYKGTKIYQTVRTIANPNTYKVTVTYSGTIEKINTIYDYTVTYENKVEELQEEKEDNNIIVPVLIISGLGLAILLIGLFNIKNTYVYSKTSKGFKLIKREKINDKNVLIDISNCKNKSKENIYAIKINKMTFNKLKGRTISIILGTKKKDIILWNNYYEIKL